MKKQDNYVSEETAMELLHANIIGKEQPVPTITECVVWFAEQNIPIITDYNCLDNEWRAMACFDNDPERWVRRYNKSYIEAVNAAIRDAANEYEKLKQIQQ